MQTMVVKGFKGTSEMPSSLLLPVGFTILTPAEEGFSFFEVAETQIGTDHLLKGA
jgi:hypothetical protein